VFKVHKINKSPREKPDVLKNKIKIIIILMMQCDEIDDGQEDRTLIPEIATS